MSHVDESCRALAWMSRAHGLLTIAAGFIHTVHSYVAWLIQLWHMRHDSSVRMRQDH